MTDHTADIDDAGVVTDWGTPVADKNDLPTDTQNGLDSSGVTLEMGALYTTGNAPATTGTLCTLTVSTGCTVTVTENNGRGGVVYATGTGASITSTPQAITCSGVPPACTMPNVDGLSFADACDQILAAGFTGSITMTGHTADNTQTAHTINSQNPAASWNGDCATAVTLTEAYNYPTCWDAGTQCHGDCDGDNDVDTIDWPYFRDGFAKTGATYLANSCADFDHDGDIDTIDWPEFRDHFAKAVPTGCAGGDPLGIYDPDP
jgi:hypothetical protein